METIKTIKLSSKLEQFLRDNKVLTAFKQNIVAERKRNETYFKKSVYSEIQTAFWFASAEFPKSIPVQKRAAFWQALSLQKIKK